jgi:hypothetical protein
MRSLFYSRRAAIAAIVALVGLSGCNKAPDAAAKGDSVPSGASAPATAAKQGDIRLRLGSPAAGDLVIGPTTKEQDLIAAFGADNVTRQSVAMAEGESTTTTVLFAKDSTRRLEIFWSDTAARSAPTSARLQGARSAWSIGDGVTLGVGIPQVETANGRPFKLLGFHWDYEGTVSSWEGGRLDSLPPGMARVIVRFHPEAFDQVSAVEGGQISGDKELLSTDPLVRHVQPRVNVIEIEFGSPER